MDTRGVNGLSTKWLSRARIDKDVGTPYGLQNTSRIDSRILKGRIAMNSGDTQEFQLWMMSSQ